MSILVTGAAGFIGFHVATTLLDRGERVIGIDNLNDYYDVSLKEARLAKLRQHRDFIFARPMWPIASASSIWSSHTRICGM